MLPLSRFTVLDLTRVRSGPTCVRQLADWGANVIKIEAPEDIDTGSGMGGDRHGPDFQHVHRNKRGITLNLKRPMGWRCSGRMVAKADVVVENYRPDVKDRLGIDYDCAGSDQSRHRARLDHRLRPGPAPMRRRPGFDQIAQGMGGLMSVTGLPGQGPVRVGIPVADLTAGLYTAIGILVALLEREQTGQGPLGPHLAARGHGGDDGLPGDALDHAARGPQAGRQRPPDHRARPGCSAPGTA